jgi:transcriptional regulator with XRE-family HTH domain
MMGVGSVDDLMVGQSEHGSGQGFALMLRDYRDRRRMSQSRLAKAASFDHSYVSRLESGSRMPTRDAVVKLADAMTLTDSERDALLAAAGFMPGRIESLFASEPVLSEVLGLLQDRAVPAEVRDDVRHMISLLVKQAHRAAFNGPSSTSHRGTIVAA